MAELYSQYTSGAQFPAGAIAGSATGVSGLNPLVDRLNSICTDSGAYSNLTAGTEISIGNGSVINSTFNLVAGEGIDITAGSTVSAELATTANKGVASFNSSDFSVSSGAVSLKSKTSYLSIPGMAFFVEDSSDTWDRNLTSNGIFTFSSTGAAGAPVYLPHGAVITACVMYGSATDETWHLEKRALNSSASADTMAYANIGTTDTSIASATIDNSAYCYFIYVAPSSGDSIYSAKITYTTDYD